MILFIIVGATTFSQILSFSGASNGLVELIAGLGLSPMAVIAGMMLLLIFLGLFVDQVSMMLITLPIFMPLVQQHRRRPGLVRRHVPDLHAARPAAAAARPAADDHEGRGAAAGDDGAHLPAVVPYVAMSLLVLALVFFVPAVASGCLRSWAEAKMERSFKEEVEKLKLGDGETFHGEAILAVTKALLQSGVAYVGGYQGAPVSHVMDVLNDARDILDDLGVHVETNANEAGAAAMLGASINYPMRGAVAFKSTVGTNVASDALSNLASAGVKGGALIVLGEDYGEGASIIQERSHAFAMKSQIWLLDPRPNLPKIVEMVEQGFELSEASSTPVMLELRIRACHVQGSFKTKKNQAAALLEEEPFHGEPGLRLRPHLPAARHLRAGEAQDRRALAGRGRLHPRKKAERILRRRHAETRHHLPGRHVQRDHPRAADARAWPTPSAPRACRSTA